jgi:hypothetical protein
MRTESAELVEEQWRDERELYTADLCVTTLLSLHTAIAN